MKKRFACLPALALVLALAACGKAPVPARATTPDCITAEGEAAETTTAEHTALEGAATEPTETETSTNETGTNGASAVPTDLAGVVAYYNGALGKTGMRRVSYQRTMTKIAAKAARGLLNEENLQDDPEAQALGNVDENKTAPSDLVALRPDWVKKASVSVSGGTATLRIVLKDRAMDQADTAFNPRPGTNGYVSTMDKPQTEQLVIDSAMILSGGALSRVDVTRTAFGLSDGVYTAVVDTATGKIRSVRFCMTQSADGEAKCRVSIVPVPVNASVTMRWDTAAAYAPA